MKAGRELDALVAEKVMGWTVLDEYNYGSGTFEKTPNGEIVNVVGPRPHGESWSPSTDIAAAWEVVER